MRYAERVAHPVWQKAVMLFDTYLLATWGRLLPSDPHVAENLRYGVCMLALGEDKGESLESAIRHYVGEKYQVNLMTDCMRLVRSAQRPDNHAVSLSATETRESRTWRVRIFSTGWAARTAAAFISCVSSTIGRFANSGASATGWYAPGA